MYWFICKKQLYQKNQPHNVIVPLIPKWRCGQCWTLEHYSPLHNSKKWTARCSTKEHQISRKTKSETALTARCLKEDQNALKVKWDVLYLDNTTQNTNFQGKSSFSRQKFDKNKTVKEMNALNFLLVELDLAS